MKWCIVGISQYIDENIPDLIGVENSVEKLNMALTKDIEINTKDILILSNETRDEIIQKMGEFLEKAEGEDFIFYFCGHGMKAGKELYMFATNTSFRSVKISSLRFSDISELLSGYKLKNTITVLDCCHSGAAASMGLGRNTDKAQVDNVCQRKGSVVLCSCGPTQESKQCEIDNKKYAVFTYCFAEAITSGMKNRGNFLSLMDLMKAIEPNYMRITNCQLHIKAASGSDSKKIIPNADYLRKLGNEKIQELSQIRKSIINKAKSAKVLLVKTAIMYPTKDNDFGIPLGLWVLKNYLLLAMPNIQVDIFDERLERKREAEDIAFEDRIEDYDVIGISLCSCEVPMAIKKFRIAHEQGKVTVAGGIFTFTNEKYLLNYDCIDYVIPGVGTKPWKDLLSSLIIRGDSTEHIRIDHVFTKNHKTSMWIASTLPRMEFHTWDDILAEYQSYLSRDGMNKIDISTSRGCNKNCSFCSVRAETSQPILSKNIDYIKEEIDYLYGKGIRYFSIKDEDFCLHGHQKVKKILEYCKQQYTDIHFKIRMRLDYWLKNPPYDYELLKKWGVEEIQYGVESPQSDILKVLHKGIDVEYDKIEYIFKQHFENQITVNASLLLAVSTLEDEKYYNKLLDFINKFVDTKYFKPYVNFLTPHPINSQISFSNHNIVTSDLNYYTHKVPVAYPDGIKRPQREKMLKIYDDIVKTTRSENYNCPIPESAREIFLIGNTIDNGEIMYY